MLDVAVIRSLFVMISILRLSHATPPSQVDEAFAKATQVYLNNSKYVADTLDKQRAYHAQNLESYKAAREHYLKVVESGVEYVKKNGISGTAKAAADEVAARVSEARAVPGALLHRVQEAVDKLLASTPVHGTVERLKPALDSAYQRYSSLHDNVVSSDQYRKVVKTGSDVLARVEASPIFAKSKATLYPYVAPYAEPAAARLQPYYLRVVEHLAPKDA